MDSADGASSSVGMETGDSDMSSCSCSLSDFGLVGKSFRVFDKREFN